MVEKIMDLIGKSSTSWPAAVEEAVSKAGESIRHIHDVDIVSLKARIENGKISEYISTIKIAFDVE